MFSLICVWINDWVNNREAGDLRRYRAHYDVIVMIRVLFIMLSIKAQLFQDAFWFVPDITFFAMWFIILLNILLLSFSINLLIDRGPLYSSMPSVGCLCATIFILTFWRSFLRHMVMMTWSNGNIFRVTDPLWEGIHRRIPHTKASDAELWCFLWSAPGRTRSHQCYVNIGSDNGLVPSYYLNQWWHCLLSIHASLLLNELC